MTLKQAIPDLRDRFTGRVMGPEDEGYEEARTVVAGDVDKRPAVIVRPTDAEDVARVIALARETGLDLAVRSGGHSGAGHSATEGGIVLDLRAMKGLEIDVKGRTAWAEAGLTAGEYTAAAGGYGLATPFGDTGTVGIGGITLAGGIGLLVRRYGMTIDSLLAAEIVTADDQLLRVDEEHHPDLFWAIRGGGGNFGVVTRFLFRLHPVDRVMGGMLLLPATAEVVAGFIVEAERAPEELSTIANVMPAPPMPFVPEERHGELVVLALMVHAGDVGEGERAVAPFRSLAEPVADLLRPMPYPEMFPPEQEEYRPTAIAQTMLIQEVDAAAAEMIVERLEASDAAMRAAQLRVLGGAMARVPADATAFAHRDARIMGNLAAFYEGPGDRPRRQAWVDEFTSALRGEHRGAYVAFLGDEGEERVHDAYPAETWERLSEVKARYDPTNLFRLNQNVPPAGATTT
ncbi:MAG TPA: FAD-binding oxidoreductase [Actinomycetota bacterium]